jgi:hypothetical protein
VGPRTGFGRRGEKQNLAPTGTRTPTPRPSSLWSAAIQTAAYRLLCIYIHIYFFSHGVSAGMWRMLILHELTEANGYSSKEN